MKVHSDEHKPFDTAESRLQVGITFEDRQTLKDLEDSLLSTSHLEDSSRKDQEMLDSIPPGEEAMFFSNAGGEQELCREIFVETGKRKRKDVHTR
ncbi:hypothetical protein SCP_0603660 [Sparassis crispa]|uniref:Uncharacterized protein n=1 Tax=Sparassis crispa TaxID=139825 RepID=A0A401GQ89_9APHY|nr:hypothetical protein SCP_0603660 [Sparassis crispa]GBE84387.1 hypothetical protein SCP_0603660 [Sparassis crispa]